MTRIDYYKVAPEGVKAVRALEHYLRASELEPALIELVKLRASLMNGCAYCVDLHTKDARAKGETEQRLFAVPVWRETPFFNPRERAALAWTEAVTQIGRSGVSDALYDEARTQFTDKELVDLTLAVIAINAWNRLAVTFRPAVGDYKPAVATTASRALRISSEPIGPGA
jgi:AhpD family alkylhydroperoxidase